MISKAKILVADDDKSLRELMKDTLESAGYEVVEASDGKQCLKKTYSENPDIIILDVNMPHASGYEVCEKIRKDILMSNLPIIMVTVQSSEKDEVKGLNLGVNDYITKPFKPSILLARVSSVLQRFQRGVSVSPLTYLPGNVLILKELETRLRNGKIFSVLFIDLDNFKAFNDYYGFQKGDEVIKETARVIVKAVGKYDKKAGFVGHIGGDDFIAIVRDSKKEDVCGEIIDNFDSNIKKYYREEDRKKGYIITENRQREKQKFPIITISIGVATSENKNFIHVGEIIRLGNELKKYAKKDEKSNYVIDRRKDD